MTKHIFALTASACLVAVTIPTYKLLEAERQNVGAIQRVINGQAEGIRSDLNTQLDMFRNQILGTLTYGMDQAVGQIRDIRTTSIPSVQATTLTAIDSATKPLNDLVALAKDVQVQLQPAIRNITDITSHADEASSILFARNALPAQTLGLLAATKVTMGEAAVAMRDVDRVMPDLLKTFQTVGNNSDKLTAEGINSAQQSTRFLKNMADNVTPLPKFIRYPAQVIGLLGSAALPVIGIAKLSTASTIASTVVQPVQGASK